MIPTLVQNVGLRVGKQKICQCQQGATNSDGNSKSKKTLYLGFPRRKISKFYNIYKFIFFCFSDQVDDEYSYAGHDFAAGGTFSFGGVTVQANRHDDDDDEDEGDNVMTSMNANDFQYGSYYNEESDEYTSDEEEEE